MPIYSQDEGIQGELEHEVMEINDLIRHCRFIQNALEHDINLLDKHPVDLMLAGNVCNAQNDLQN